MTKNLVPLIAKELGLEIGEVFTIRNADFQYRFTEHWVEQNKGDGKWTSCEDALFIELVVGGEIIDKISDDNESEGNSVRTCTVFHADQNLGGCGIKGAIACCKDCPAKPVCVTVCTKSYEVGKCVYEETKLKEGANGNEIEDT